MNCFVNNTVRVHFPTNAVIACSTLGIPVVFVAVLVALNDRNDFITKHACWCRGNGVLFWTFVGTIGLILLVSLDGKKCCTS